MIDKYQTSFSMMGTHINLLIYHHNGKALIEKIYHMLVDFDLRFSANRESSELMNINKNAGIKFTPVNADLFQLIRYALAISQDPNNPFNIAIGPLVKLWRIGFRNAHIPTSHSLYACLDFVNPNDIKCQHQEQAIYLSKKGMEIDLGAIAKGYFADVIKTFLVINGVKNGFIDLGGNVLTIGCSPTHEQGYWAVGIQEPLKSRGNVMCVLMIKDVSVVTSGIYERCFMVDNKIYHHLLDMNTGQPINTTIASITIISNQSIDGEIWSTAGFQSSVDKTMDYLYKQKNIQFIIIDNAGKYYLSKGLVEKNKCIYLLEDILSN